MINYRGDQVLPNHLFMVVFNIHALHERSTERSGASPHKERLSWRNVAPKQLNHAAALALQRANVLAPGTSSIDRELMKPLGGT